MGKVNDVLLDYLWDNERFADLFNGSLFGGRPVINAGDLWEGSEIYVEGSAETKGIPSVPDITASFAKGQERSGKPPEEKTVLRTRDLKKWLRSDCALRILAVENQNQIDYAIHWRGMNYDEHEYRRQIRSLRKRNQDARNLVSAAEKMCGLRKSDRLIPVFTVCLYHGEEPWDGPRSLKDMMDFGRDGEQWEQLFSDYRMHLICLNELTDFSCFHSPLRELFGLIPYRRDKKAMQAFLEANPAYRALDPETARTAGVLIGLTDFDVSFKKYHTTEGYNMCTALRELVADARDEGWNEGRNKGREEGKAEGKAEGIQSAVFKMFGKRFSCREVADILDIDIAEIDSWHREYLLTQPQ